MIKKLHTGDTFYNSVGSLVVVESITKNTVLLYSNSWFSKVQKDKNDVIDKLNSNFYKPKKIKDLNKEKEIFDTFYVLKRKGTFTVSEFAASSNQCYQVKHPLYEYNVICVVKDELDEQGFIVDHETINNYINHPTKNSITVSCENMHNILHERIHSIPELKSNILALKTIIKPAGADFSAFMEKVWYDKSVINNVLLTSQLVL